MAQIGNATVPNKKCVVSDHLRLPSGGALAVTVHVPGTELDLSLRPSPRVSGRRAKIDSNGLYECQVLKQLHRIA